MSVINGELYRCDRCLKEQFVPSVAQSYEGHKNVQRLWHIKVPILIINRDSSPDTRLVDLCDSCFSEIVSDIRRNWTYSETYDMIIGDKEVTLSDTDKSAET